MNKRLKTQIKGGLLWLAGMLLFAVVGAFVDVILGWKGLGYGGIIGCLWLGCIGKRYKLI